MLAGCGALSDLTLRDRDNGDTVASEVGQTFFVKLEGDPATGYQWEVAEANPQFLQIIGEAEFEPNVSESGEDLADLGGVFTFRIETINEGETSLRLVYRRPFEEDVDPLREFQVRIQVR